MQKPDPLCDNSSSPCARSSVGLEYVPPKDGVTGSNPVGRAIAEPGHSSSFCRIPWPHRPSVGPTRRLDSLEKLPLSLNPCRPVRVSPGQGRPSPRRLAIRIWESTGLGSVAVGPERRRWLREGTTPGHVPQIGRLPSTRRRGFQEDTDTWPRSPGEVGCCRSEGQGRGKAQPPGHVPQIGRLPSVRRRWLRESADTRSRSPGQGEEGLPGPRETTMRIRLG